MFFNYLGFRNVAEFIKSDLFTAKQRSKQLELLVKGNKLEDYYYIFYYFGEDNKMNKGQVVIYNNWKTTELTFVYTDENGEKTNYTFYGVITQSEDFAFFDTKFYVGNKKNEGAKFICFIGNLHLVNVIILLELIQGLINMIELLLAK